ncbi:hypothetical protein N7454_008227 [Penicillium verhagenii]|nr:hypothetical protein N7454_008227 [Penicillium verhagenii]
MANAMAVIGASQEADVAPAITPSPVYPNAMMRDAAELTELITTIAQRHPNLNLTAEEKRVFYQLFQAADTTNLGVITGEIAVPFFEKTHLPGGVLGEIWQIADRENRGLLTPAGFGVVLRLIGHAQAGRTLSAELALQPGPLPRFDGISVDTTAPAPEPSPASPPPGASGPIRVPPLQPDDVNKFVSLFDKSEVVNGIMSGDIAKQIFERARLPNEVLGRIWNLSDTQQRGALDSTEFVIAMHLLTSFKSGVLRGIPQTLPAGLYEAASRRAPARSSFGARPEVPPVPSIPRQFTGSQRTASPMNAAPAIPQFGGQLSAQTTGGDWLITPQEKVHFDGIFETVDTAKRGLITGDQAVGFFMKAQLPEEVLAQIWDLADIDADGQLTREEFAVAMYLVRLQRGGKEPVPQVLPPALIPPNMRRQAPAPAQMAAPAPAPAPVPRSAADDLFGLDSPPAPAPAQLQMPQSTGGSAGAWHTPTSPASRASPPTASTTFKPFVPTSTFGQSLQPQLTGASSGHPGSIRSPPPPFDDLLGDNDPEETKKLTQETTELANLSNQIGSLSKEMHNVQQKRTSAEHEITQSSQQKRDFEARLAQARTMYEQELASFKALEERLKTSKAETIKLSQEYALIEGSRQDLANQYNQVSTALASDQQENASLKEKIRYANAEVAQLKPALEKARSDARQQKGLVAINKKQLATVEGERDKAQGEIDDLARDTPQYTEDVTPVSSAAELASPAASTTSQNTNPFFRRTVTGSESDRARSPDSTNDQQKAFDSLFGQTFASPISAGPPPTSFRAESPLATAKSPVTSNVPTPSASPAPGSMPGSLPGAFPEPPPPSISRQLTPNFLPFNENQSVTSSTMVSPPASRFGQDTSGFGTPSQATTSEVGGAHSVAESSDYSFAAGSTAEGTPARSPFEELPPATEVAATVAEPSATSPLHAQSQDAPKDLSFDELFGSKAHKRSESQKGNDFEEAFASMKPAGGPAGGPANAAATGSEFPPIQELHHDEEGTQKGQPADSIDAAQLAAFPSPGTAASPPQYENDTSHEAPEFNGLLPVRSDPTAAPDAPHSVESATGAPIIDNEPQREADSPAAFAPAPEASAASDLKSNTTDFDAAFAGLNLAPAQEAEDDDDEPEGQNKNTDFDFSFDSPSQPKHETASSTDLGHSGSSEFFDFDNNAHATAQPTASANGGGASNHDWDTLFAPLDNAKPAAEEGTSTFDPKKPGWALDTDTGEDDLILQRLTGMGFPRDDSLVALEKFDYNLDKAADYLTSK